MKISIEKIIRDPDLVRMAAEHLAYSLQDVKAYHNLTPKEREIISKSHFDKIQAVEPSKAWLNIKTNHKDRIVLVSSDESYNTFGDDARILSRILNIALTNGDMQPHISFPVCSIDTYLPKIVRAGHVVALCDI